MALSFRGENGRFLKGTHWRPPQPFRDREWLMEHYVEQGESTGEIARAFGVTDAAILFWMRKHHIPRRNVSQARALKSWGLAGEQNGMYGKTGALNPHWKGGVTPDRQAFYASRLWKQVKRIVWERDGGECQRCHARGTNYHHIVSFAVGELRAVLSNVVLLCEDCHDWVHSRANTLQEFLGKGGV